MLDDDVIMESSDPKDHASLKHEFKQIVATRDEETDFKEQLAAIKVNAVGKTCGCHM